MTDTLRVEKHLRTVRFLMDDGAEVRATIFVAWGMDGSISPQAVVNAISDAGPVVPCEDEAGRFMLLGREAICGVAVRADDSQSFTDFVVRHPAQVSLRGGHQITGHLLGEMGLGDRFSDALRSADPWFRVEKADECYWLRTDRLIWAREEAQEDGTDS